MDSKQARPGESNTSTPQKEWPKRTLQGALHSDHGPSLPLPLELCLALHTLLPSLSQCQGLKIQESWKATSSLNSGAQQR